MASPSDIKPVFPSWPTRPVTDQATDKHRRKRPEEEEHKHDEKEQPERDQGVDKDNDGHIDEYA